jgi:LPXTG-motif cell wall-anchored protein
MYQGSITGGLVGAGAAGATLPQTGLNTVWQLVLAVTLVAVGIALARLAPRVRRQGAE